MNRHNRNATIVGIATLIMVIATGSLLIWKSTVFLRVSGYELVGDFQNINGLLNQAQVRYRGYQVGKVSKILPGPQNIRVHFWVHNDIDIPQGSTLRVVFDGLVGEKFIDINPNKEATATAFLPPMSVLPGYATSGLADFVDVGTQSLQELKEILASMGDVLTSTEVNDALRNTILGMERMATSMSDANIGQLVINLEQISDQMRKIVKDDSLVKVDRILDNLEDFSKDLSGLLGDAKLKGELTATLSESRRMFKGSGDLLSTLTAIRLNSGVNFDYYNTPKKYYYSANFDFWMDSSFLRFGVGNKLGDDSLVNIQQSIHLAGPLRTRFGIFYTKPGIGFDYIWNQFTLSSDFYNFDTLEIDVIGEMALIDVAALRVGYMNATSETDRSYTLGLSLHPAFK
ncbi:MCE family protein [bacterium]|jgi:ABC-type transporter Mla subunit MlaD|nr:MCE family protein [bacterium]